MKITSFKIYTCAGMTSTVMVLVIFFSTNFMGANLFLILFSVVHSVYNALRMGATYPFGAYITILGYLMLIKGLFIVVSIFVYNVCMRIGAIYINIEYEGGIIWVEPKSYRFIHVRERE